MDELPDPIPMLTILLRQARIVPVEEAAAAVTAEIGPEAAATVNFVASSPEGLRYIDWRVGEVRYHLGTSTEPYLKRIGVIEAGAPLRWTMQEEVPPREPRHCEAWMAHEAWMYVDALDLTRERVSPHLPNVLKVANHFVDEACTLLWLWGGVQKHVSLPTPRVREALAKGRWIEE
jgi:hypothetical protein